MTITRISAPTLRLRHPATGLLVALVVAGSASAIPPAASSAATLSVDERIALKLTKRSGSTLIHRGRATGTIPGSASARSTLRGLKLAGTVTIKAKRGTLRIKIRGNARSNGVRTKFDGTATMDGGTGAYRRARGTGRFEGIVNRDSWAATIRATGKLTY